MEKKILIILLIIYIVIAKRIGYEKNWNIIPLTWMFDLKNSSNHFSFKQFAKKAIKIIISENLYNRNLAYILIKDESFI